MDLIKFKNDSEAMHLCFVHECGGNGTRGVHLSRGVSLHGGGFYLCDKHFLRFVTEVATEAANNKPGVTP